jgi:hypothetical protein
MNNLRSLLWRNEANKGSELFQLQARVKFSWIMRAMSVNGKLIRTGRLIFGFQKGLCLSSCEARLQIAVCHSSCMANPLYYGFARAGRNYANLFAQTVLH